MGNASRRAVVGALPASRARHSRSVDLMQEQLGGRLGVSFTRVIGWEASTTRPQRAAPTLIDTPARTTRIDRIGANAEPTVAGARVIRRPRSTGASGTVCRRTRCRIGRQTWPAGPEVRRPPRDSKTIWCRRRFLQGPRVPSATSSVASQWARHRATALQRGPAPGATAGPPFVARKQAGASVAVASPANGRPSDTGRPEMRLGRSACSSRYWAD